MAKLARKPRANVLGLILHFGHVESTRIGTIILRHRGAGFATLPGALTNLADYLMVDYLDAWIGYERIYKAGRFQLLSPKAYPNGHPTLEQFQYYLDQLPFAVASAGPNEMSFDSSHVNEEEWWPWDTLIEVYPELNRYYENVEQQLSEILCHYLTLQKIPHPALRAEVKKFQTLKFDGWGTDLKDHKVTFCKVAKRK